jgi:AsmA protein
VLFYGGVLILMLAVGAGTFFFMSPPTDYLRREIIASVKRETGRDLTIGGGASFTLFPSMGLRLSDVTLSSPPGMGGEPLLTASSFDVGVNFWPLLRQEILVDRLELVNPIFSLRIDQDGRRSWDMASLQMPVRFAGGSSADRLVDYLIGTAHAQAAGQRPEVKLDDIRVTNGAVRYDDERNGAWGRFDGINAKFSLAAMNQPLVGEGSFVADGETFNFKSTLTSPGDIEAQRPARLELAVSGTPLSFSYQGTVGAREGSGKIAANSPSLSAFGDWWGFDVTPEAGSGEIAFTAQLTAVEGSVQLSDIDLKAGPTRAAGTVSFQERPQQRPFVSADLKVAGLNAAELPLGANLRVRGGDAKAVPAPTPLSLDGLGGGAAPATPGQPNSIEDLLERPGPKVKGYAQRGGEGWGTKPINIEALGLVDANIRLALTDISYGRTRVDSGNAIVALQDKLAKLTLTDLRLYDGVGHGVVTLDASSPEAAFTSNVTLSGIASRELLRDAAQVDWLAGKADVSWNVAGRGDTEAAIVQSLGGNARVAVDRGSVIGFDLGAAMDELSQGSIPRLRMDPTQKTDFSELTGTFVITNGIATNNDLKLASSHLNATGAGSVDIPARSLDYTVKPKLLARLGSGEQQSTAAFEVPVQITGSWEEPQVAPDIGGALNNSNTVDAVKQLGKQLKGKNAGQIVEDLFGKGDDGSPSKAEKLLDGFLGR